MTWVIAAPVFGESYWKQFEEVTLPRFLACLAGLDVDVRWVIHTDRPEAVARLVVNAIIKDVDVHAVERHSYEEFVRAHREAFELSEPGDVVVFLCADAIFSKNALHYAKKKIEDDGMLAVVMSCARVHAPHPPRVGATQRELLDFSMLYPHPIIRETFFPWGRSALPVQVYFTRDGESIVLRAMHLHPLAVKKISGVSFDGTVDDDLLDDYPRDNIHVVQNGEISGVEISPPEKTFGVNQRAMTVKSIFDCYAERASDLHRWYFEHPIRIAGDADCGDEEVAVEVRSMWSDYNDSRVAA